MTLNAETNQQSPNEPWTTSLLSVPSAKNFASSQIWVSEYHSIKDGLGLPAGTGSVEYKDVLFCFPPSFGREPNS